MQASLDYAQALLKAKDLTEVMRLHSEYVQGQMRSLAAQCLVDRLYSGERGTGAVDGPSSITGVDHERKWA